MAEKKPDPIDDRARALSNEIAALEAEIKKLDSQLARAVPEISLDRHAPGRDRSARPGKASAPAPAQG